MTASTAATDSAALSRSSLPASGSRYSGSSSGPSTSSSAITGTASRNTDPHQNYSSSIAAQQRPDRAADREAGDPHRRWRPCAARGSRNMLRISDSVDGATVAPATPSRARVAISIAALVDQAASTEAAPNAAAPISSSRRRPMRSPRRPHGDQRPGDHEPVDVDDPQQLGAAGLQVLAELRDGQVQHGQVHRVQQARNREHGQADPLSPSRLPGDHHVHELHPAVAACRSAVGPGGARPSPVS